MKNLVLISASPKINEPSISKKFLDMIAKKIDIVSLNKEFLDLRQIYTKHTEKDALAKLAQADAIIVSFPLYYFCLPGILISFLENFYRYYKESGQTKDKVKIYAIVNCGFPEPENNLEAARVIESFSRHINAEFRFGVLIGAGPMMLSPQAMNAPFMKKTVQSLNSAFEEIVADIKTDGKVKEKYIYIGVNFPRRLYFFMGGRGWIARAKKNGLKKKDLYRRPYQV